MDYLEQTIAQTHWNGKTTNNGVSIDVFVLVIYVLKIML